MRLNNKKLFGFTLIELIVTVAIAALVVGGGIAGFTNFADKQEVLNTAKEVQQMMRTAQSKARVRDVSASCTNKSLNSYKVRILNSGAGANLSPECNNVVQTAIDSITFPSGVTVTPVQSITTFKTLEEGATVINAGSGAVIAGTFIFTDGTWSYNFTVSPSGSISNVVPYTP